MKNRILLLLAFFASTVLTESCTKLQEKVLDEASVSGLTDQQIADGTIAPVYALLAQLHEHTRYFTLQEITTDEAILPYRGGTDWGDNNKFIDLHRHATTPENVAVRDVWNPLTQSLSRAVSAISQLTNSTDPNAPKYLAEAKGMYAYYNMVILDLWGIVFKKEDPGAASTILRGAEAVAYIEQIFLEAEPLLDNTTGPGRITKAGIWGLLARLHLNAAVYRDRYASTFTFDNADMDKVIDYTNRIISSSQFVLATDYWSVFNSDNHTNKELIFAVDQRAELNGHNRLAYFSLSGDQRPLAAFPGANGTDGPAITSEFYQSWISAYSPADPADADPRFHKQNVFIDPNSDEACVDPATYRLDRGILRGQQYGLKYVNGAFVSCGGGKYTVSKLYNANKSRPLVPVIHTELVDYTPTGSDYSSGYRVLKYEFSQKSASGRNFGDVDFSIVRLADVYMMRAEAKLRKGDASGALADVNTVRNARTANIPSSSLNSITLDILFRERGFELYWEYLRRTDMIRFGKFEGTWGEKSSTDKNKRVFPIPHSAIDGSGYLVQNDGY
jgi:hypothetical protein